MKTPLLSGVVLLLLVVAAENTQAQMTCGTMGQSGHLITNGLTKLDVILKCGQPDLKEVVSINSFGMGDRQLFRVTTSVVEAWHYNCGEARFNKSLFFDGSTLALVTDTGQFGSGPERCY